MAEPKKTPAVPRRGRYSDDDANVLSTYLREMNQIPLRQGAEDGILTAEEAQLLDLRGTELVALSACETGLGDIKNGEGVFGLQRAFRVAGARYLLMSLWRVADRETMEFMVHLYEQWLGGSPVRRAYDETVEWMKNRYPDPYLWGAFVLIGN